MNRAINSTLAPRNITVAGKRTSVRLEVDMWDALADIGRRELLTIHQIATKVAEMKGADRPLTSALRMFAMTYFRVASTEEGHARAGHGNLWVGARDRALVALAQEHRLIRSEDAVVDGFEDRHDAA